MDPSRLSPLTRLKRPAAVKDTDRPAEGKLTAGVPLAKLIKRKLAEAPELVMLTKTRSVGAEKFRRLRTILANRQEGCPQVVVVTSAGPGEGKSLCSINLALAFAADEKANVVLVDADLRRPTIERWLSPEPKLGLAEVLKGRTELEHAVLHLENSALKILPAGSPPRDPVGLLSSDVARDVMAELRAQYTTVIVDTPPIVPFTDADVLGALSDGVVVVARSAVTRVSSYIQAVQAVTSTRVLGTVLNDLTFNLADRTHYYGYEKSYDDYYSRERKE